MKKKSVHFVGSYHIRWAIYFNVRACCGFVFSLQHVSVGPLHVNKLRRNDRNITNVAKETKKENYFFFIFPSSILRCQQQKIFLKFSNYSNDEFSSLLMKYIITGNSIKLSWFFIQKAFFLILNELKFSSTD